MDSCLSDSQRKTFILWQSISIYRQSLFKYAKLKLDLNVMVLLIMTRHQGKEIPRNIHFWYQPFIDVYNVVHASLDGTF